ncbi:hypothetical protein NDU88_011870 [Pleurodeles waltl]|uniref:Uncharacterized protein n=1 Tax=Pleurodeles waltl TaxID=8319 RepID=A0AAV7R0C4_PLEWA|nr:hypothetical protein NDU88_011870 [Pleurodeles waltl]
MKDTEASQRAVLSIGFLPKPRDSETVKGAGPPTQGREEELRGGDRRRWRGKQEKNSGGRGTKTLRKTSGPVSANLESSRSPESCGFDNVKRITGPGEHTNEPATLQEKRGQARPLKEEE